MKLTDEELADELIERLNKLIEHPAVAKDVAELLEHRIRVSATTADHPTIQVVNTHRGFTMGMLGVLNGLVGVINEGPRAGWGYITAEVRSVNSPPEVPYLKFIRTRMI